MQGQHCRQMMSSMLVQMHHMMIAGLGFLMFKLAVVGVAMIPASITLPELDKKTS